MFDFPCLNFKGTKYNKSNNRFYENNLGSFFKIFGSFFKEIGYFLKILGSFFKKIGRDLKF